MDSQSSYAKETAAMAGVNDDLQLGVASQPEKTCPPVESETYSFFPIAVQTNNEGGETKECRDSASSSEDSSCNVLQLSSTSELKITSPAYKCEASSFTAITVQTKNEAINTKAYRDSVPSSEDAFSNDSQLCSASETQKSSPPVESEACSVTPVIVQTIDEFKCMEKYRDLIRSFEDYSSDSDSDSSSTTSSSLYSSSSSKTLVIDGLDMHQDEEEEEDESLDVHQVDDENEEKDLDVHQNEDDKNENKDLDVHQDLYEQQLIEKFDEVGGGGGGGDDDDDDDDEDDEDSDDEDDDVVMVQVLDEPQHNKKSNCQRLKTKDEVLPEELPAVEDLFISVPEDVELKPIGVVSSILNQLVIIESLESTPALNEDSIIFRENRCAAGKVFEIFGPVRHPYYVLRFNDESHVQSKGLQTSETVYFAPSVKDLTQYIFAEKLKHERGSDASWKNDQEPPPEALDFSDDEKEKEAKQKRKKKPNKHNKEMVQINYSRCGGMRRHFQNASRNNFSSSFQSTRLDFPPSVQRFVDPSQRNFGNPQCPPFSADHSDVLPTRICSPSVTLPTRFLKSWPPKDICQNNSALPMNPPVFPPHNNDFQNNCGMKIAHPGSCPPNFDSYQSNSALPMNHPVFPPNIDLQNNSGMQFAPPGSCPPNDRCQNNSAVPMTPPVFHPHNIDFQNNRGMKIAPRGSCPPNFDSCQNNATLPVNPPVFPPHNIDFQNNCGMQAVSPGSCPPNNDSWQNNCALPLNPPMFPPPNIDFQNNCGMQGAPPGSCPPPNDSWQNNSALLRSPPAFPPHNIDFQNNCRMQVAPPGCLPSNIDSSHNNSALPINPPLFPPHNIKFQNNYGMQVVHSGSCPPNNDSYQNNSGLPMSSPVCPPHNTQLQNNSRMQGSSPEFCLPRKDNCQNNSGLPVNSPVFSPCNTNFQSSPGIQATSPRFCPPSKDSCQNNTGLSVNPPHSISFQNNSGMQIGPPGFCPLNNNCQNNPGVPMNPPVFPPHSTSFQNNPGMQGSLIRVCPPSNIAAANTNSSTNSVNAPSFCSSSWPSGSNQVFPSPTASAPPHAFHSPPMQSFTRTGNSSESSMCQQPYTQTAPLLQPTPPPPFSPVAVPPLPHFGSDFDWRDPICGPH